MGRSIRYRMYRMDDNIVHHDQEHACSHQFFEWFKWRSN